MKTNIIQLLIRVLFVCMVGGLIILINHKVFQNQYDPPKNMKEQMEFPLSKVTVQMDKSVMRKAFKHCSWIDSSRGFTLSPVKGSEAEFLRVVNKNNQAERISSIYKDLGFKWDAQAKTLTLASDGKGVLVPTWILYELVSDGCFQGVK